LILGLAICFDLLHSARSFLGSIKKTAPGGGGWKGWDQRLEDLSLGVLHTGELGLAQPLGLEDLLSDQG